MKKKSGLVWHLLLTVNISSGLHHEFTFRPEYFFQITTLLLTVFPEAKQVRELDLENATDIEIWNYARNNNYCIVTFDSDFIDISNLKGTPPKVIWLRCGNTTTKSIAQKMIEQKN